MGECTDTTNELIEEMRRIGRGLRTNRQPTYDFAGSLFRVADRLETAEAELRTLRAENESLRIDIEVAEKAIRTLRACVDTVAEAAGWSPGDDYDLVMVVRELRADNERLDWLERGTSVRWLNVDADVPAEDILCEISSDFEGTMHTRKTLRAAIDAAKEHHGDAG